MTGLILLTDNNMYALPDGDVSWGPEEDKAWVREQITGKSVLVGYSTFATIMKYKKLMSLAKQWYVPSYERIYGFSNVCRLNPLDTDLSRLNIDINFGGPHTFQKYPPDKIIVHTVPFKLSEGLEFPISFFDGYTRAQRVQKPKYLEDIYVKK